MASTVTASVVVQFTKGTTGGILTVEVDGREVSEGGLNGGDTSFLPGDTVALLMYKSPTVVIDYIESSMGVLYEGVTVSVAQEEDIIFADTTEGTIKYPAGYLDSYTWLGNNLGTVTLTNDNQLRIPAPATGDHACGVLRVTYTSQAKVYRLQHSDPGLTDYSVLALFIGHSA